jgi:mevalonate kinase
VAIARENGAFGAKLVGAGGGGFCAALMKNRKSALNLITILEKHYQCFYNLITAN